MLNIFKVIKNRKSFLIIIIILMSSNNVSAIDCNYVFNNNLKAGARSDDVYNLQKLLNSDPRTQIADSGAGSPGRETGFFGPGTLRAVVKYQELNADSILTPAGLTNGSGFVGSLTRKALNKECNITNNIQIPSSQNDKNTINNTKNVTKPFTINDAINQALYISQLSGDNISATQQINTDKGQINVPVSQTIKNNINNYKTQSTEVFNLKLQSVLKKYQDLYIIYNKVLNNYLISASSSQALLNMYNSLLPGDTRKTTDFVTKINQLGKGKDRDQYQWRLNTITNLVATNTNLCSIPSTANSLQELNNCFISANTIDSINQSIKRLDYFESLISGNLDFNKNTGFDLNTSNNDYDNNINYIKDIGDDTLWQAQYDALYSVKDQDLNQFNSMIATENKNNSKMKNGVYYVKLNEDRITNYIPLYNQLRCYVASPTYIWNGTTCGKMITVPYSRNCGIGYCGGGILGSQLTEQVFSPVSL